MDATDNKGITKVEFYVNNTLKATKTVAPYEYTFDSKSVSNGSVTVKAKAYDAANNTAEATINVTVNNENQPPIETLVLNVTSPSNDASFKRTGSITVTGTSQEPCSSKISGVTQLQYINSLLIPTMWLTGHFFTAKALYLFCWGYKIVVTATNADRLLQQKKYPLTLVYINISFYTVHNNTQKPISRGFLIIINYFLCFSF